LPATVANLHEFGITGIHLKFSDKAILDLHRFGWGPRGGALPIVGCCTGSQRGDQIKPSIIILPTATDPHRSHNVTPSTARTGFPVIVRIQSSQNISILTAIRSCN
jgi:hypothetical protein